MDTVKFEGYKDNKFCEDWEDYQVNYTLFRLIYPILFVFIINGPISYLLTKAVTNLRIRAMPKHSKVEFIMIFIFETIGIGFTFLISTAVQQYWDQSDIWNKGIDY